MALIGVGKMDDGIPVEKKKRSRSSSAAGSSDRKIINVDAALVDEVNAYAEDLEDKLGFRPTFTQALLYILKELRENKR